MSTQLTKRGAATKHRIVSGAAELMRAQGVAETNLDQILHATSTSKSQLFHYFPDGRAGLLVAVTGYESAQVMDSQRPFIDDLSSPESWRAWRDAVVEHYVELGERCPMGALTASLGKSSPDARQIVSDLYDQWEGALAAGVQKLIDRGGIAPETPVRDTARSILAAIQGGVVMLQATGRADYLEAALDAALAPLLDSQRVA